MQDAVVHADKCISLSKWKNHLIVAEHRLAGHDVNDIQTKDLEEVATRRKTLFAKYTDDADLAQSGGDDDGLGDVQRTDSPTGFADIMEATSSLSLDNPGGDYSPGRATPVVEKGEEKQEARAQSPQPEANGQQGSASRSNLRRPVPRRSGTRFSLPPSAIVEDGTQTDDVHTILPDSRRSTMMYSPVQDSFPEPSPMFPVHLGIHCDGCKVCHGCNAFLAILSIS